jgi:hypothetical protein
MLKSSNSIAPLPLRQYHSFHRCGISQYSLGCCHLIWSYIRLRQSNHRRLLLDLPRNYNFLWGPNSSSSMSHHIIKFTRQTTPALMVMDAETVLAGSSNRAGRPSLCRGAGRCKRLIFFDDTICVFYPRRMIAFNLSFLRGE